VDDRVPDVLRLVAAAAAAIARAAYRKDLLALVARYTADAVGAPCLVAATIDGGIAVETHGDPDRELTRLLTRGEHIAHSTLGALAAGGTRILRPDDFAVRFPHDGHDVTGLLVSPIWNRDQLIGGLALLRFGDGTFEPLDVEVAGLLADQTGPALVALGDRTAEAEDHSAHAQRFLDAIVENIPDMVFVKEAGDLSFVRFNKAGEDLLGIPRDQLIGKNDFDFFPRDEAEFFVQKDRETLANKTLVDIPEEPIQTASGQRWLHTKKVPIVDAHGMPRYLLGISSDITDAKRTLGELHEAKEAAEIASRELEAFSYSVAHDLRAPLRAIDGFSQALLEDFGGHLDEVGHGHLERVRHNAQRMANLIDDLLELSRVTRWNLVRQPIDLATIARQAIEVLRGTETRRTVEVKFTDDTATSGDPKLLAIVFDNLCGNAWKFTSKLDTARLEIGGIRKHGEHVFYVRDNGVGFDPKYVNKLFGVFQRLHPESEFPGTGIGLATVQRIVHRHGGRVWAEGQLGEGATFYFTLGEHG